MPKFWKTKFNDDWLTRPEFCGIIRGKAETEAYCNVCKRTIQLSNMGIEALKSHTSGSRHRKNFSCVGKSSDIRLFAGPKGSGPSTSTSTSCEVDDTNNPAPQSAIQYEGGNTPVAESTPVVETTVTKRMSKYLVKDDVSKAEILWCVQAIENHSSLNSAGKQASLFQIMFPDSIIASSLRLDRTKISYGIVFRLAPYFIKKVIDAINESGPFVVLFDESLNKMAQAQQMDIALRFWNKGSKQVETHYLSSAFLGHGRATDLLAAFKKELQAFNLQNLLQVSMDGPNVNLAFLRELEADLRSTFGDSSPIFVNMGSCGLHIVNNSFKQGAKATEWNIIAFLRSAYYVFKDTPSRRSDFLRFNKPDVAPLPAKFCNVRWLENEKIAATALRIIPNLKNYVQGAEEEKIPATSKTFKILKKSLDDKLLSAKLSFFCFVSQQITPFLKEYQCDAPMSPFLHSDLSALIRDLMSLFVNSDVPEKAKSVCDVDLKKESNLKPLKKINLGYAVKAEIRKLKVNDAELLQFKTECRTFLFKMCSNLILKCPVKYKVCKAISFCDPQLIVSNLSASQSRLSTALQLFSERNWVSSQVCDIIEKEFKQLCSKQEVISLCKEFKRSNQMRLDHFWRNLLDCHEKFQNLYTFIKKNLSQRKLLKFPHLMKK